MEIWRIDHLLICFSPTFTDQTKLTIKLSQSGLLLYKFINTHLFLGGERRLGQSATHTPGTAQHSRTPIEVAPIFPLLPPATQLVRARRPTTNSGSRRL
jgi:hypothetical protein